MGIDKIEEYIRNRHAYRKKYTPIEYHSLVFTRKNYE